MTAAELTDWEAFEEIYGPILPHDRIDIGFATLGYYIVSLLGKSRHGRVHRFHDFLPPWLRPHPKPLIEDQQAQILEQALRSWATVDEVGR